MNQPTTIETRTSSVLARLRAVCPKRGLTSDEARTIAEHQASLLLELSNVRAEPVGLALLERLPRLKLRTEAGLPSSGASFWDGDNWQLIANGDEHPNRQRFSLLHEYKHVIDHPNRDLLYAGHTMPERVADHFAACVLMPRRLVTRAWCAGLQDIHDLADRFAVSPQAMERRVRELGHIDQPQLRRYSCARGLRTGERFAIAGTVHPASGGPR